jgi:histone-lysine N-methyltransferase SETMAR
MDKSEQRVVMKFLWMRGLGARRVHSKLSRVLGDDCYSLAAIERWLARFQEGDLSCGDQARPGRPQIDISGCLRAFLDRFPFASANMMAKHFRIARGTVTDILRRDLGLRKFTRRWVPHQLSPAQKADRVKCSRALLLRLQQLQQFDFEGITTGDESWFRYQYDSDSMFARSADMVVPRLRAGFQVKKTMVTIFFTATRLLILNCLPQGQVFTQDYFRSEIVPAFTKERLRFRRFHPGWTFSVHMDNSRCHNGRKATAEFERRILGRAEHPPYSPDLSPCDFWLFGFLKEKLKDRQLHGVQSLHQAITELWDAPTFEELQAVFLEWMNRLSWVIRHNGEYFTK